MLLAIGKEDIEQARLAAIIFPNDMQLWLEKN